MAILSTFTKQPSERLDYDFDFSAWLNSDDAIASAQFSVVPETLTLDGSVIRPTYAKVWVSGGENGVSYKITCTASTVQGRVKEDEIRIRVKEV